MGQSFNIWVSCSSPSPELKFEFKYAYFFAKLCITASITERLKEWTLLPICATHPNMQYWSPINLNLLISLPWKISSLKNNISLAQSWFSFQHDPLRRNLHMTHQFWQSGEVDALNTPKLLTLWDLLTCSILCKSSRRPGWKGRAQINYSHRWEYKYILFLTHAVLVLNGHS